MTRRPHSLRSHLATWGTCLCLVGGLAAPVQAAPPVPSAASEKQALVLASQAKARYAAKDYAEAARLFMEAYGQVPEPTLLFNAARAYQEAGRLREALPLFQLYLSLNRYGDAESKAGRREAEQHVAAIQAELQRQGQPPDQGRVPPADKTQPDKTPPPQDKTPPDGKGDEPPPPPPAGSKPPDGPPPAVHRPGLFERVRPAPEQRGSYRTAALVTGTTGLAMVLTGALLRSLAGSDLNDLNARLQADRQVVGGTVVHTQVTQREAQDAYGSHNSKQVVGNVLLGVGVAAIGTGVALWLLQTPREEPTQARVWPVLQVDGAGAGLSLAGRF